MKTWLGLCGVKTFLLNLLLISRKCTPPPPPPPPPGLLVRSGHPRFPASSVVRVSEPMMLFVWLCSHMFDALPTSYSPGRGALSAAAVPHQALVSTSFLWIFMLQALLPSAVALPTLCLWMTASWCLENDWAIGSPTAPQPLQAINLLKKPNSTRPYPHMPKKDRERRAEGLLHQTELSRTDAERTVCRCLAERIPVSKIRPLLG